VDPRSDGCAQYHFSIFSDPFEVYGSKNFPGLGASTDLTRHFSAQGLRLRVRKEPRSLLRKFGPASENYMPQSYNRKQLQQETSQAKEAEDAKDLRKLHSQAPAVDSPTDPRYSQAERSGFTIPSPRQHDPVPSTERPDTEPTEPLGCFQLPIRTHSSFLGQIFSKRQRTGQDMSLSQTNAPTFEGQDTYPSPALTFVEQDTCLSPTNVIASDGQGTYLCPTSVTAFEGQDTYLSPGPAFEGQGTCLCPTNATAFEGQDTYLSPAPAFEGQGTCLCPTNATAFEGQGMYLSPAPAFEGQGTCLCPTNATAFGGQGTYLSPTNTTVFEGQQIGTFGQQREYRQAYYLHPTASDFTPSSAPFATDYQASEPFQNTHILYGVEHGLEPRHTSSEGNVAHFGFGVMSNHEINFHADHEIPNIHPNPSN
jgi:hypothetical protein